MKMATNKTTVFPRLWFSAGKFVRQSETKEAERFYFHLNRRCKYTAAGRDASDISFEDPIAAFQSKTTSEVLRAYSVFMMCSSKYLVENNLKLMKVGQKVLGKKLFAALMRRTFYGQFVAGADEEEIQPTIDRLRSFGVNSILDYSVEEDVSSGKKENAQTTSNISAAGRSNRGGGIRQRQGNLADHYKTGARTHFYLNEGQCEKNLEIILKCIETVSGSTKSTGFAAIKMTALGRPQLLMQLSDMIVRSRQYFTEVTGKSGRNILENVPPELFKNRFNETKIDRKSSIVEDCLKQMTQDRESLIHLLTWSGLIDLNILLSDQFKVPNLITGCNKPIITVLTEEEEEMFSNMIKRLDIIFSASRDLDVSVMVDAEQTYFQPAISRLTMEMMHKYNNKKAVVFNTYQCYLKDAYENVNLDLEQAKRQGFYFGAKLVRGAYMEQERDRAAALGYEDPINPTYEATSEMYEKTLMGCLQRIAALKKAGDEKRIAIMVASHNEDTVRFAIKKMNKLDILPEDKVICFGQLLGMCDQISFPLGQAGYSVYKYVPYGPVNEVLPYLSRRANENQGTLKKIKKEKRLLLSELVRRVRKGQLLYKPQEGFQPI